MSDHVHEYLHISMNSKGQSILSEKYGKFL